MFKLILTSFRLALFSQDSFSVIYFFLQVLFRLFNLRLFTWRLFVLSPGIIWYLYIYRKKSVTTVVCVCDLSIDSKTIFCAIVLMLIITPTIMGKNIYHINVSYTKRDWSVPAISFDLNSHVSCTV